ncbi:Glycosyltransferase involved in cell wall bisynthesis [Roseivivax lentus]|uniref:Glycosyltransferase involved in cell wall bisynthesis n=1 Tax=Roseivivax lentus TaxID=633194 RepID=A0A1N7P6N9_9RHOB|nr:glycosyltransferase family 1 protein [Roseivivax lentus]SIT06253.1 Glycosyltransferase involved in cell wall bisynthesis [Roseivivax lentus]
MTLAINARFLTQPVSGVQRYAHELLGALDTLLDTDPALAGRIGPVTAFTPRLPEVMPAWSRIALACRPGASGHVWEQTQLATAARDTRLLSLGNSGPLRHRDHIVAFHDTHLWDMPEAYDWRYRAWHKALRGPLARRAAHVLCVSDHARRALSERLNLPQARVTIVPNAADHIARHLADPTVCARYGLQAGGYLLTVGNASPNKNVARLVAAHRRLEAPPVLVVVGGAVPGMAAARGLSADVAHRFLGRVPDVDLANLMRHARGFVFPSLHEGFGIPPLEAMALGVPVAAAWSGALPDVLGASPVWFDPEDVDDIARGMRALLDQTGAMRARSVALGLAQSARFGWAQSARRLAEVILTPRAA